MSLLQRILSSILIILLMVLAVSIASAPFAILTMAQNSLKEFHSLLGIWYFTSPTNFIVGQAAIGVISIVILCISLWLLWLNGPQRGAIIYTANGGSIELDIKSISRRLEWHLEQIADVSNVVPIVKAKKNGVDIRLEVEVAPEIDVPMKTDEVVLLTRDVIEEIIGLRLGKLDVHLRYAPADPIYT